MRFLITTDTVGGVWTFTRELTTYLLRDGHVVCLVSFGRAPSQEQRDAVDLLSRHHGSRFYYEASAAPLEWMPDNARAYADGAALLQEQAKKHAAEVLLSSQFCYGAVPLPCPTIVIAHSDVMSWAAACGESLDLTGDWMQTYRALVQGGLDNADAVVVPTSSYLSALREHFAVTARKVAVISNGRDGGERVNRQQSLQAVTAGRFWDKAKGIAQLSSINSAVPILVAGELRGTLPEQRNVHWIGQRTSEELLALFEKSALYICTSLYEPFGLAPLEAALCGCAVIARNIATLREVWGDAAFYFDSTAQLEQLLQIIHDDAGLLREMQMRAIARARTYSPESMTRQYVALSHTLVSDREVTHAA